MIRLNFFSLLYLVAATAFAAIGFAQMNLEAWLTAGFALLCAVLSLFPWWHQVIINMGKQGSLIFDAVVIIIALAIQGYGLLSNSFLAAERLGQLQQKRSFEHLLPKLAFSDELLALCLELVLFDRKIVL